MGRKRQKPLREYVCAICGTNFPNTHLHHIIERHEGGPNKWWNLIEICPNCHDRNHHGNLKILEIMFSSAGHLIRYTEDGIEKIKPLVRQDAINVSGNSPIGRRQQT